MDLGWAGLGLPSFSLYFLFYFIPFLRGKLRGSVVGQQNANGQSVEFSTKIIYIF